MRLRLGLTVAALLAAVLVLALLPGDPAHTPRTERGTLAGREDEGSEQPRQTSDGAPGEIAEPIPPGLRFRARIDNVRRWRMAPGVRFRRWDQTDARGQVRAYLVRADLDRRGVRLDYASGDHVPDRAPVTDLLARDRAVAGTNGGFFDIFDTGAPLGVGRDRERGSLHATKYSWRNAFWIQPNGRARIGVMPMSAQIAEYPQMEITNVDAPRVREGKIGIWDASWGTTSGYSITDGQKRNVRMVVVADGRVVANTTSLSSGKKITGTVLVGRGPGAEQLRQLRPGARATVQWQLDKRSRFAIGGESILLRRGRVEVTDDRILHPRTAVGIDRDRNQVLLLVIDGRQRHSRGYTMVELARMMRHLGAETALNFDGGGSSTMAGKNRRGRLRLLNQPSDGTERQVADGLEVLYARPRG